MDTELMNLERRLVTMYHSTLILIRKNQTFNIEQQLHQFQIIVEEIPAKYFDVIQKWPRSRSDRSTAGIDIFAHKRTWIC